MELNTFISRCLALVNDRLDSLVPESPENTLACAVRYSLLNGGKRLRPLLTLATCDMLNNPIPSALTPACAIEMIHTYSLIHDDLPCMDDDDMRRGKPSLHKKFTESTALLAGDFLLTYAFETLSTAPDLTAEQRIDLITALSQKAGSKGMIGGQFEDMAAENQVISLERLQSLHMKKTGALISAAIEFGAILSNAPGTVRATLSSFGSAIGLAFQIVDDILDATQTTETLGKPARSDLANQKSTYVSLLGIEAAQNHAQELIRSSLSSLQSLPYDSSTLQALTDFILLRNS